MDPDACTDLIASHLVAPHPHAREAPNSTCWGINPVWRSILPGIMGICSRNQGTDPEMGPKCEPFARGVGVNL